MHKLFISFIFLVITACNSELAVMGQQQAAESGPPEVFALNRLQANAGDLVQVSGINLVPGLFVTIGGKSVELKVTSPSSATFVMPLTDSNTSVGATFSGIDGQSLGTIALVDSKDAPRLPVMDVDPGAVCSDQTYQNPQGHIKMGLRNCSASFKACELDGETSCVASSTYPAVSISALQLQKKYIRKEATIAGVTGTLSDCTSDGETGCVAEALYPALQKSLLTAAVLKAGTTINGVTGIYPSAAAPLASPDAYTDLDISTFNAKIKASASFGWYDRNGTRYAATGDSDLATSNIKSGVDIFGSTGAFAPPCASDGQTSCLTDSVFKSVDTNAFTTWDIRYGKTVGGVAGSIQFFKNLANLAVFNRTAGPAADVSVTSPDFYDTVNDMSNNLPTQTPNGFPSAPGSNWLRDPSSDNGAGGGTAANGSCDGTEDCVYLDRITGAYWAKDDGLGTRDWSTAISDCDTRVYGGYSDWRLPTQKELWQSVIDGIIGKKSILGVNSVYWTSSTDSGTQGDAWSFWMEYGHAGGQNKTTTNNYALCVR